MHLCGLARIAFFGSLLLCASLTPSNQSREGRKVTGISRHFGTKFAEQLYRATGLSLTPLPSPPFFNIGRQYMAGGWGRYEILLKILEERNLVSP